MQWRTGGNTIIDLDRQLRLLERLIEIGERQQRKRMAGGEEERQL